jgi:myosin heavy chain 9/10/11/14
LKLSNLITHIQAYCRGYLSRKNYQRRLQQLNAIRVIQRNCSAYLKLRNWEWWRLFTKVKPLLQVTNAEEKVQVGDIFFFFHTAVVVFPFFRLSVCPSVVFQFFSNVFWNFFQVKDEELKIMKERMDRLSMDYVDFEKKYEQLSEEKSVLLDQLQTETEACAEAEEMRARLAARQKELEEILQDTEGRLEEEENRVNLLNQEKKKLQDNIRDLEEELEVGRFFLLFLKLKIENQTIVLIKIDRVDHFFRKSKLLGKNFSWIVPISILD